MPKFKSGDVVQMLSGGPKMIVIGNPTTKQGNPVEDVVKCCWVSDSGYYEQELPEDFLVATQPVSA